MDYCAFERKFVNKKKKRLTLKVMRSLHWAITMTHGFNVIYPRAGDLAGVYQTEPVTNVPSHGSALLLIY